MNISKAGNPSQKEKKQFANVNPALVLGEVELIHSLSQAGIPVYVGSEGSKNPSAYSRHAEGSVVFSTYRSKKFIDELCKFSHSFDRKVVIFSDDDDAILTISRYREHLKKHFLFLFPDKNTVKNVLDKQAFGTLAHDYNLSAPASFSVSNRSELQSCANRCTFPCIIKPIYRSDWYHKDFEQIVGAYKKAFCCSDKCELFELYEKIAQICPRVVIQEYIPGEDHHHYSVNMYVDDEGQVRGHYIARKIRVYPIGAGMGSLMITVKDKEILERATEIVRALDLSGLLNIQFKKDCRTGEPKLLEIHFRNSVWGYLGASANMNLYKYYYHGLTGKELPACREAETGVKYVKLSRDIPGFFQYYREGKLSFLDWIRSYHGRLVIGGFKASDPVPFLMNLRQRFLGSIKNIIPDSANRNQESNSSL